MILRSSSPPGWPGPLRRSSTTLDPGRGASGRLRPLPKGQLAAALLGAGALLVVVGLATHANVQAGSSTLSHGRVGLLVDVLVAGFVLVGVIVSLIAVWMQVQASRFRAQFLRIGGPARPARRARILATLIHTLILAAWLGGGVAAFVLTRQLHLLRHALPALTNVTKAAATASEQVNWPLVAGAGGGAIALVLLGGGVLLLLWRSRELSDQGASLEVVSVGLEELRGERDPRRAVIRAYAAMERVLGALGLPRRPAEAPYEYLGRVLIDGGAPRPAATHLTELFEQARFSRKEIGSGLKAEALDALADIRDSIKAAMTATEDQAHG